MFLFSSWYVQSQASHRLPVGIFASPDYTAEKEKSYGMLIHELVAAIKVYNFIGHLCICIEAAREILHHLMCDRGYSESFDMLRMNEEFYYEIIVFSE